MISKLRDSIASALQGIADGATVMIGGFGGAGQPAELIDGLIEQGATDLVIINNNAGNGETGLAALLKAGRVRKIVCSFPRQTDSQVFDALYRAGRIELELVPQGNLAERIRAAGAGIGGFFTPTGYGTALAEGKETREIGGRMHVFESPLPADVALIKAERGDRWGNLTYRKAARNFGPIMASAGQAQHRLRPRGGRTGRTRPRAHRHAGHLRAAGRAGAEEHAMKGLTRNQMAARVAQDIPDGAYVNLGIGLPTLVANHLPSDREIFLHSENGILGMGPAPAEGEEDWDLINAGKQPVTLLPGGAYFHHADSFAMMRGGHIDICVLGAFQVSRHGDLANWHTGAPDAIPAVGGAMDLAVGARKTFVMMEHVTKAGESKLVERCSYPLTGVACVSRIYTDLAVLDVTPAGLQIVEIFNGIALEELRTVSVVPLIA